MNRLILCIVFILCAAQWTPGAVVLKGKIALMNSGGKPVENAQVAVDGTTIITRTDAGFFELQLPRHNPGDIVSLTVLKEGFEVVDKEGLEHVILENDPEELIEIVMCPEGSLDKNEEIYFAIAEKTINEEYEIQLKRIQLSTTPAKDAEIDRLNEDRDFALTQAEQMTGEFAYTNLDDTPPGFKKMFKLFREGDIAGVFRQLALDPPPVDSPPDDSPGFSPSDYILRAQFCMLKLRFTQAEIYFDNALKANPGDSGLSLRIAEYYRDRKNYKKSEEISNRALTGKLDQEMNLAFLSNLAVIYSETSRWKDALNTYTRVLEIRRNLAKTDSFYLSQVADTLYCIGELYQDNTRFKESRAAYEEAIDIWRKLNEKEPKETGSYSPDIAGTLINLGILFFDNSKSKEAQTVFNESIRIHRELVKSQPGEYLPGLAVSLYHIGLVDRQESRYSDALTRFDEAYRIQDQLAKQNTPGAELDLCRTLLSIVELYITQPNACESIEDEIPSMVERVFSTAKKYPGDPQAQEYIDIASEYEGKIKN